MLAAGFVTPYVAGDEGLVFNDFSISV